MLLYHTVLPAAVKSRMPYVVTNMVLARSSRKGKVNDTTLHTGIRGIQQVSCAAECSPALEVDEFRMASRFSLYTHLMTADGSELGLCAGHF